MKIRSTLSLAMAFTIAGLLNACGDANEAANREFVTLAQATSQAMSEPDQVKKYDRLLEVQTKTRQLLANYPQSNVAVRISADEKIGPLSPSAIQRELAALSSTPAICRLHLSSRCLNGLSAATYAKLNEQLKAILWPSFQAVAIRSGDSSGTLPAPETQETRADAIAVGFFLADEGRRDPEKYWEVIDRYLGRRFEKKGGTHAVAFSWTLDRLLGGVPTPADFRTADRLVEAAPANERQNLKTSLRFEKGRTISLISPPEVVEIFDQLHGDEINDLSTDQLNGLPDQMIARAPAKAVCKVGRALPINILAKAIDGETDIAAKQQCIRQLLYRRARDLSAVETSHYIEQLKATERGPFLRTEILRRAAADRSGAALLAAKLVGDETDAPIWTKTVLALGRDGFTPGNVAAIRSLYANKLIDEYNFPLLEVAASSGGAISAHEGIDALVRWLDGNEATDAQRSLATAEALKRSSREGGAFPISDPDYADLVKRLIERDQADIEEFAWRIRSLRARGFSDVADLIEKRVTGAAKAGVLGDPRRFLAGPHMRKLIEGGEYVQALERAKAFNEEDQMKLIESMLRYRSEYADKPLSIPNRDLFLATVADKDPSLAYRAISRQVSNIAGDPIAIKLAERLANQVDEGSSIRQQIHGYYMDQLYRHPDEETLKAGVFAPGNVFTFSQYAYLLMRTLVEARR